mmetsp:Transcript_14713/g.42889  ORF Transcript_14713/g.42889 Transcript_14713/m.42889 type:complete len:258 (+) Transcript_14713:344-1117(+)
MCAHCMKKASMRALRKAVVRPPPAGAGTPSPTPRLRAMDVSCLQMLSAWRMLRSDRKCSLQNSAWASAALNCENVPSRLRWSPRPDAKILWALSAAFWAYRGRWKAGGTESIATIAHASSRQPLIAPAIRNLLRCGSTGNSAMCAPTFVSSHSSSTAPRKCSISRARIMASGDGGSMKSKWTMSSMPSFLRVMTTELRSLRMISGYVLSGSSFSKESVVYSRKHFPGCVRPARPARCIALAFEIGDTKRESTCVRGL